MKRPPRPGLAVAFVVCAVLAGWALHSAVAIGARRPWPTSAPARSPVHAARGLEHVRAVMHLHTRASWDATGSPGALRAAALRAHVPVVFMAEHNNTHAWEEAGWFDEQGPVRDGGPGGRAGGRLLVVPGVEVSLWEGHQLVWGASRAGLDRVIALPESVRTASLDSLVRAEGAFAAVAHPRGARRIWKRGLPPGASATEIVNADVAWRDDSPYELARTILFYPFDARASFASLIDTPAPALAWWDSLLATRDVAALAGLDAHGGVRSGRWSLPFPPYRAVMRLVAQHLWIEGPLSSDAGRATTQLLEALRAGRHYAAFDAFGNAEGFAFWASATGGEGEPGGPARAAIAGGSIALAGGRVTLHARVPRGGAVLVRLVRVAASAVSVRETSGWEAEFEVDEPGAYRVEVYQRRATPFGESLELPWIFSNPIRVTP